MTNFKIGDHVKIFPSAHPSFTGKIVSIANEKYEARHYVTEDGFYSCHNEAPFHAEQMRLLDETDYLLASETNTEKLHDAVEEIEEQIKYKSLLERIEMLERQVINNQQTNIEKLFKRIEKLETQDTIFFANESNLFARIEKLETQTNKNKTSCECNSIALLGNLERIEKLEQRQNPAHYNSEMHGEKLCGCMRITSNGEVIIINKNCPICTTPNETLCMDKFTVPVHDGSIIAEMHRDVPAYNTLPKPGTFESVLPALRAGKKIRLTSWDQYHYFDKSNSILRLDMSAILATDWVVVE